MNEIRLFVKESKILKTVVFFITVISVVTFFNVFKSKKIEISNQINGKVYFTEKIKVGDILSFEWEHSFEHTMWKEFYELTAENDFKLFTIAIEGFGAGIPAEMNCTYRYEEGLIYMENIEGSRFKEFNWINSQTQLKSIKLNDIELIKGKDLPEREKIKLFLK